jgi:hypothetical protein
VKTHAALLVARRTVEDDADPNSVVLKIVSNWQALLK